LPLAQVLDNLGSNQIAMFKNYLLSAFRSFGRNKIFSVINILGLAIGISASLVIYLIVHYEFSYEKFHKDRDRIYRVVTNMHFPNQDFKNSGVPGPLPAAMRSEATGIESSALFVLASETKVKVPSKHENNGVFRKQKEIAFADDQYFNFIKYEWLAGSPANALKEPNKVVLTESRAKEYFAFNDIKEAMGHTIIYDDSITAMVSGIVKDLNEVTDLVSKEFVSLPTFISQLKQNNSWDEWGSVTSSTQFLVKLKKGVSVGSINGQIAAIRKKHEKEAYLKTDHFLQPLSDVHFNSDFDAFDQRLGHKPTLFGLLVVAAFLLVLGCINFINLTTAQGSQRAKEIGVRKTMGSTRSNLVSQFLTETFLLTIAATLLSLVLTPIILKIFADFIPPGLTLNMLKQPVIIGFILLLIIIVSLISGFYPALVLSKFKPVTVLKNVAYANTSQSRRVWVRKTLTVSQFIIAQFFIIATLVVGQQIKYSLNKNMGFRKDAIITFNAPYNYFKPDNKKFVLLEKLRSVPGINKLSLAGGPPANSGTNSTTMKFKKDGKEIETTVEVKQADTNYFSLYNMKLAAGRNLQPSDTTREYVVNETYARFLGYTDPSKIVGESIERSGRNVPIVGVIKDFNSKSIHKPIGSLVFTANHQTDNNFNVLLAGNNASQWRNTILAIEKEWKEIYPEEEFSYTFFDESIAKFYKKEKDIASLLNWSTGLAVFISCLGLLGLVIYTTTQRVKEIGVRKVLGATVSQIVALLSKDFLLLVIFAFLIAAPVAWWAMNKWLEDFAFRTNISWWIFAVCGLSMVIIALLTLSIQTVRSATVNPVKSLRSE
jgi:predicted permease